MATGMDALVAFRVMGLGEEPGLMLMVTGVTQSTGTVVLAASLAGTRSTSAGWLGTTDVVKVMPCTPGSEQETEYVRVSVTTSPRSSPVPNVAGPGVTVTPAGADTLVETV